MLLDRLTDTQFVWLLLLVFVVTFYVTFRQVVRYLNKRWPRR